MSQKYNLRIDKKVEQVWQHEINKDACYWLLQLKAFLLDTLLPDDQLSVNEVEFILKMVEDMPATTERIWYKLSYGFELTITRDDENGN